MNAINYLYYIAERNFDVFLSQGFASPGNNGPHGHLDTPVRNTAHYLIIYSYLYKRTLNEKYKDIAFVFANYLRSMQSASISGSIKCMETTKFDHLNGLIGQGWVIEALIYFSEVFSSKEYLLVALKIYYSQKYDKDLHLWHRIELDGSDLGIDITYNHNVWFAACSYKLAELLGEKKVEEDILDFLDNTITDFRINRVGLLDHAIGRGNTSKNEKIKDIIRFICTPIRFVYRRKLDPHYIQYGYQIFDIYGFEILKKAYPSHDLFGSSKFAKAEELACNICWFNKKNRIGKKDFNVYGYGYNSPSFEFPFVYSVARHSNDQLLFDSIFEMNKKIMYDDSTSMFSNNNFDVETWNARTYELIRYLELLDQSQTELN